MRGWSLALLIALGGVTPLVAQDSRDSLVNSAVAEFDTPRRIQLLVAALDPSLGPPRGNWDAAIQLLAQTLLDEGKDSAATTWMRWAIRLSPGLTPDTVRFLPQVAATMAAAREFVRRTASADDSLVTTSWVWAVLGKDREGGGLLFKTGTAGDSSLVSVAGVGRLTAGVSTAAASGSYAIRVSAPAHDSAAVTREVIPGMTTVLAVHLRPTPTVAPPPLAQQPAPQAPLAAVIPRRKHFPWVIAALGTAGAGTLVAVLAGGGGKKPSSAATGGITITFPNP